MKVKYLLIAFALSFCANANAEWFLRGTHNAWAASQMESAGTGTNTMQLKSVVFNSAGNIKFDRFGDWSENYGVGGLKGSNIPVAAGAWDIKFFTDTKKWSITASATYHLRGTFNTWLEGTLMTRLGTTDIYESCINFVDGDANGGPRFKIDPNGGWGDGIPATDFLVTTGWAKISFNSASKTISVQQNLAANCTIPSSTSSSVASSSIVSSAAVKSSSSNTPTTPSTTLSSSSIASSSSTKSSSPITSSSSSILSSSSIKSSSTNSSISSTASIYHLRGTFNSWQEGTLMPRVGTTSTYESCVNFLGSDANGGPRFKIDPNGGWGDGIPAADFLVTAGWVKITFDSSTKIISVQQKLAANCAPASSSSVASTPYHVRGTFNSWAEGTLMTRVGTTDNYEFCVNFPGTNPRFKIDPNGGWGDGIPSSDFVVNVGWVKIFFNSTNKAISVQQNLSANCGATSSSSSSSIPADTSVSSSSVKTTFHLRGTVNGWAEGTLMDSHGTDWLYDICINMEEGNKPFRIDKNGGWGIDVLPVMEDMILPLGGWTLITYNRLSGDISAQMLMQPNCGQESASSSSSSTSPIPSEPFVPYHIRGTHNAWEEGMLMSQIATTSSYEACINFESGDANGGPRFRIDPNGGWGDAIPSNDFNVPAGWVKIGFNSITKEITKQTNMRPGCIPDNYSLVGTQRTNEIGSWKVGDFFELVDGNPQTWKICRNFTTGDNFGGPRFRIMVNEGSSADTSNRDPSPTIPASGWTSITFTSPSNSADRDKFTPPENVHVTTNLAPNCATQ